MKKYIKPAMNIAVFGSECRILTDSSVEVGDYSADQLNEVMFGLNVNATKTIKLRDILSID